MNQWQNDIFMKKEGIRKRKSSYDTSGGNKDFITIEKGQTACIADINESGIIKHIWMTLTNDRKENYILRRVVIRMFWDEEETPSVEAPIGDFFGMGHGISKNYISAPLQMSPEDGNGLNSWWPMPFRTHARIEIQNESNHSINFYYYIDYESQSTISKDALYFHALWHRECPTKGKKESSFPNHEAWCFQGDNVTGEENYILLDAEGEGHYCGANINIHNLNIDNQWNWPGEGDDMIFIDGEKWPPSIHGTGTEDYVNMAWCPTQEYHAPYHGLILGGSENWKGKISYYRYHILDPIMFTKSIKVTIEHGHNNNRSDDYSTTAYWYQREPHKIQKKILNVEKRLPVNGKILLETKKIVFEK